MATASERFVTDHTEIVNANVGKLRAACYLADCPKRRVAVVLKPLIDLPRIRDSVSSTPANSKA